MNQRILIVEDESDIAESLAALLAAQGYETSFVLDGAEALPTARKRKPHLILLDVMLPRISGFDVCKLLRADPKTAATKIIMVTGLGRGGDVETAFAAGADDYLIKPFDTERLLKKIRTVLTTLILALGALQAVPAGALDAAAAKVDITPDLAAEKTWLAGFGAKGRTPKGVHDPLHARILLLREGQTVVAVVALDLLGFYRNDVADLRRLSGFDTPGRSLFLSSTHTHSGPDTLGLWGPRIGASGVNLAYHARIKRRIADALNLLEEQLRPVSAAGGHGHLDPRGLCRDSRDPQVIDPNLAILKLRDNTGRAVATVVNWSCHPEVIGRDNDLLTADYPGPLCDRVEEKAGGTCLFLNGMIGGLMTPDARAETFDEMDRIGAAVADAALKLGTSPSMGRKLAFRSALIRVPVENSRYRLVLPALTFGHALYDGGGAALPKRRAWSLALRHLFFGLTQKTQPWVETEVSLLDIGPARLLGIPGEAFPELALGGYDGSLSFGRPVVSTDNALPPDLPAAPKGPYLREQLGAKAPMLVGLANDELGYLVPGYDFKVRPGKLMLPRLPGHYEETNSIGPTATNLIVSAAEKLLKENP
jgi:CheY-like chemotaxis protein